MSAIANLKKSIAWRVFPWTGLTLELSPHIRLKLINRGDFIILQEIFIDRVYEPFLQKTGPVRTWIDLGCNCGMFSLYLFHYARLNKWHELPQKGSLIDANAHAIQSAKDSFSQSDIPAMIDWHLAAVAPRSINEVTFYEGKTTHKSSLTSLGSRGRKQTRPRLNLDQLVKNFGGQVDLIKIDIEGAERHILDDWSDSLQKAKHLIFEWHEPQASGEELNNRLTELGYRWRAGETDTPENALTMPTGCGLWSKA